jgi:hypothetical protein
VAIEDRLKLIDSAQAKVTAEDAVEGISLTVEEREVVAGALDIAASLLTMMNEAGLLAAMKGRP